MRTRVRAPRDSQQCTQADKMRTCGIRPLLLGPSVQPPEPRTEFMHRVLTRGAWLALVGLATMTVDAAAQAATPKLAAVNTVLDFRLNWVGDATPFNACS